MADRKLDPIIQIDGEEYSVTTHTLKINTTIDGEPTTIKFDGSADEEINVPNINDFKYNNSTPTINSLGGISAKTTFNNVPITDVLDMLLYPYIAPKISEVSRTDAAAVLECGTTQTLSSATIKVVKQSKPITSIKLLNGSKVLGEKTGEKVAAGGGPFTFDGLKITVTEKNNPNLQFKVTDGTKDVEKYVGTSTFVYPYYYGVINANTSVTDTINNLINKAVLTNEEVLPNEEVLVKKIENKSNKTCEFTLGNQRAVFAYPTAYGELESILDVNNYNIFAAFDHSEENITVTVKDENGETVKDEFGNAKTLYENIPYYVYVAKNASTASEFEYTFKYPESN